MPPPPDLDSLDFRALALQAPVAWSVIDLDGNQVLGNDVYARLFGYEPDEIASLSVNELTHPDDLDTTADYLASLIDGKLDRYETDKRYVRKDGSEFVGHLVASVLRDDAGDPAALVGVIADVTRERSMAEALERSEDRLSKMLTNISDTVTLVDADGSIHATTGTRTEILGYPTSFWSGKQIFDIAHPDDMQRVAEMAARVLATPGAELIDEFRVRHHAGHYEHVEIAAVNLVEDPSVGAVVVTSRNITERKANERALTEMRDAAVALAEQRAAFVANVSHELRTPLHAVLGLTELLADSPLQASQQGFVTGIRTEAVRLRETVDDLLDYARIEADGITLEPAPVDVAELVEQVVARARATEYAAGLAVDMSVADDVPRTVHLDGHRVDQVLTNLVGNAVKFTRSGRVDVDVTRAHDQLVFVVRDTGPGVPAEHREAVFQPFTQVPGTSAVGGSGLGLALVKGLVELMRGSVSLTDGPHGGSIFRLALPFARGESTPASGDRRPVGGTARPPRAANVLVVEDNDVNQLLVRQQLDRLGHRATIVGSGREAIDRVARPDHGFDLILMDWQLPDVDGIEATRRIRADERAGSAVPIIAVTASAMPEDRAACRRAGMDDFLPKPVALSDLGAMIERWLPAGPGPVPEPSHAPTATVRIDEDRLEGLVQDLDSRTVVGSLVDRYLIELTARSELLDQAQDDGDFEVLHRIGHTLRSTSEMLGAVQLSVVCRRLEAATTGTDVAALMADYRAVAASTEDGLRQWLGHGGSHG